jgi:hypothetical protein
VQKFILETVIPNPSDKAARDTFCDLLGDLYSSVEKFKLLCTASPRALDAALEALKSK